MPQRTLRASAPALPTRIPDTSRFRRRLADAAERIIAALDALDAPAEDLEDGHDREDDPAELGIADVDGLREQLTGEPSLGFTEDLDQRIGWGLDRASSMTDAEATGTDADIASCLPYEQTVANREAAREAGKLAGSLKLKRARKQALVMGLPFLGTVGS